MSVFSSCVVALLEIFFLITCKRADPDETSLLTSGKGDPGLAPQGTADDNRR